MTITKSRTKTSSKGVYKTPSGSYFVDTSHNKVRINRRGFKTIAEAKRYLMEEFRKIDSGLHSQCSMKFDDFLKLFIQRHLGQLKKSTSDRYMIDIERRIKPFLGHRKLKDISVPLINAFQQSLIDKRELSPKSINNCLGTLRTMFTKAVEWGFLPVNPVKARNLKVNKSSDCNWWDKTEYIERFIHGIEPLKSPIKAALLLGLECGMRVGEVAALDKSDINFERCEITISKTYYDKDRTIGTTKNGKSRLLKFTKNGRLHKWLSETCKMHPKRNELFIMSVKKERITGNIIAEKMFKRVIEQLGLPKISYHGLRHTFASHYLINDRGTIYQLSKLLGHSSITVTAEKYAHHSKEAGIVPSIFDEKKSEIRPKPIVGEAKNSDINYTKNPQQGGGDLIMLSNYR